MKNLKMKHVGNQYFPNILKLLRIMKLTALLLLVFVFNIFASETYSQPKMLTLKMEDAMVENVLSEIQKQSEFYFIYSEKVVNVERKVSIDIENQNVETVLKDVFAGTDVTFAIKDKLIVLSTPEIIGITANAYFQQGFISGTVRNSEGSPLPGVTVVVKGTTQGTVTGSNGEYTISNVPVDATLVYSFVGMRTQEVLVGEKSEINVVLEEETIGIEEVVAIGYGTQRKIDLTGSVATVTSDDIVKINSTNLGQAIQGRMTGVQVTQGSGQPGSGVDVKIRGVGSILSNNSPLVLVDGFQGSLDNVDANNIESITVLKDAAAASIYGSRAANGVILVTTKLGKKGDLRVDIKSDMGVQSLTQHPHYLNGPDWARHQNEARLYNGKEPYWTEQVSITPEEISEWTDWLDYTFRPALIQNHHLGFSGGTEKTRYAVGLGYINQEGTIIGTQYDRYNVLLNIEQDINTWGKVGARLRSSRSNYQYSMEAYTSPSPAALMQIVRTPPTIPPYFADGTFGVPRDEYPGEAFFLNGNGTPAMIRDIYDNTEQQNSNVVNVFAEINLFKNLKYRFVTNGSTNETFLQEWEDKWEIYAQDDVEKLDPIRSSGPATLSNSSSQGYRWEIQNLLTYDLSVDKHTLNVLLGYSAENGERKSFSLQKADFPNNEIKVLSAGNELRNGTGSGSEFSIISQFGRLNYSFLDKYLFQANVRRDGSSVFAPGRHYGVFPAFSAGWRISEESFMENLVFVSSIKLRAGWGQLGNANIPSYAWISTLAVDGGYVLGNSQARYPAYFIEDMTNEDVKWETTTTTDVGIDFSLFDGAVSFVGDIYEKKTTDMLLRGTIPQSAGFSNGPIINIGEVKNKGWEMQLTYQNRFNELNTALSFNLSQNKSEITDLGGVTPWIEEGVLKYDEGLELGTFWGYQVEGIWQNHDEIRNNAHRPNDRPGMYRYADLNGYDDEGNLTGQPDGIINDADKTILGSYSPSLIYGFNMEFDYKGFDFSAFFQGEADKFLAISSNDGANGEGENENIPQYYFDNRSILDANGNVVSGSLPASGAVTDDGLWDSSEIQNVSYLRLKNIQLGYSLPKPLISKLALKNVRIYLNATNLLTWTDFVGYDPEFKGGEGGDGAVSDSGIDFYPLHKTIGGGLQITF